MGNEINHNTKKGGSDPDYVMPVKHPAIKVPHSLLLAHDVDNV